MEGRGGESMGLRMRREGMLRRALVSCVVAGLAIVALARALAQEPPAQQHLRVTADEIAFDANERTVTATGAVRLTGEGLLLTCGQLRAALDQQAGQMTSVEATGSVQFEMTYRQAEQDWQIKANGEHARLLAQERVLVMEGGAVVEVQGGEPAQQYRLTGDNVQFELDKRRLVARKTQQQPEMEITLPAPKQEAQ